MVGQHNRRTLECVLLDLNTQGDFLGPGAACLVKNAPQLLSAMRRVVAWAKWNHIPVISSIDSHRDSENTHDGFARHCIDGTPGQRKVPFTLLGSRIRIEGDNTLSVPLNLFGRHQQVIFRKRTHDLFGNPKADHFLSQLPTKEYILFGVGVEYSLKTLALGLLARHKPVTVVMDCCGFWSGSLADLAFRQMKAKGALLVTVEELLRRRLKRRFRYPLHPDVSGGNGNGRQRGNGRGGERNGSARNRADTSGNGRQTGSRSQSE
ncbi:MAG TPA: isochorismatase family protein [Phycisphaerae bacterium]|nr:isochorismatase family protein [Phycisphaerae bacterium]